MRFLVLFLLACGGASGPSDAGERDDLLETINKQCKKWEVASWRDLDGKWVGFNYCTRL